MASRLDALPGFHTFGFVAIAQPLLVHFNVSNFNTVSSAYSTVITNLFILHSAVMTFEADDDRSDDEDDKDE
jgi:hypothetical protein